MCECVCVCGTVVVLHSMSSIKVAVWMRPLNDRERGLKDGAGVVTFGDDGQSVRALPDLMCRFSVLIFEIEYNGPM